MTAYTQAPNYTLASLPDYCGQNIFVSDWVSVGQDRVDLFAECTDDHHWIYTDVDRSARESPYGGAIAHEFLTLSLLVPMQRDSGLIPSDVSQVFVSGVERLRFLTPVKVGMRLRIRVGLLSVEAIDDRASKVWTRNWFESDSDSEPVLVGDVELKLQRCPDS